MDNVNPSDIVEIVQKYSGFVNSLCHRYFIIGGTSDDLFQEGVIGILQACKNYKGDSLFDDKFEPFVKMCIKRQIIDALKNSNRKKNKALNESLSLTYTNSNDEEINISNLVFDRNSTNDPLEMFIDREKLNERLKIAKTNLSELEREVLEHYLAGEKQAEIAVKLNKEVKVIDNTLQRIKNKIAKNTKNNEKIN